MAVSFIGPKIKLYLFGIAARPTEKLAAQIILFAFKTIFFIKKNRNRAGISIVSADFFRALFISNLDRKSAECTLY